MTGGESTPVSPSAPRPGDRFPGTPFVVVGLLGQGGMGEVFEVEHAQLGRRFALKMLHLHHLGRRDLEARMREEARALAGLRHPNVVDVFDLGMTSDGRLYFAMEALRGRDLRRELGRFGVLAVPAALGLMAQALDGLEAAHRAGVVHRDIKLENLFLCEDGSLKILDFGIAKFTRGAAPVTYHGRAIGTLRCMAPEQHAGGAVDARTDTYAAGIALYELIAGRGPFEDMRGSDHAMRFAHCERPPPPPSKVAPQLVPPGVEEVILRALAKAPGERFQSAAEMAVALRSLRAAPRAGGDVSAEKTVRVGAAARAPTERAGKSGMSAVKSAVRTALLEERKRASMPRCAAPFVTLVVAASTLVSAAARILPFRA
jgi:serine/threonine protein kinase